MSDGSSNIPHSSQEMTVISVHDVESNLGENTSNYQPIEKHEDSNNKDIQPSQEEEGYILPYLIHYWKKFQGIPDKKSPPHNPYYQVLTSCILTFVGLILVSITDYFYLTRDFKLNNLGIKMLTGAYAATAVLIYDAYQSPLAQPRNVFGGYLVSSFLGVTTRIIASEYIGLQDFIVGPLAVAIAILGMNLTKTVHPPGGACSLIAVIGGSTVHSLGYGYVLTSIGAAFIMLCVAVIGNNLVPFRQYPVYWW